MKKFITLLILFTTSLAFGFSEHTIINTGKLTTDATVLTVISGKQYFLKKIKWVTDRSNNLTIKVYDNTSAKGKLLTDYVIDAMDTPGVEYYENIPIKKGLYVDITSSGTAGYWIEYSRLP